MEQVAGDGVQLAGHGDVGVHIFAGGRVHTPVHRHTLRERLALFQDTENLKVHQVQLLVLRLKEICGGYETAFEGYGFATRHLCRSLRAVQFEPSLLADKSLHTWYFHTVTHEIIVLFPSQYCKKEKILMLGDWRKLRLQNLV